MSLTKILLRENNSSSTEYFVLIRFCLFLQKKLDISIVPVSKSLIRLLDEKMQIYKKIYNIQYTNEEEFF